MNYQTHYDLLISRSKSRILEGYSEKHHIIPSCLGGDNSEDNLVKLTPEEHYLAHQLLVKIYSGNHKLVYAANMMSVKRPGNKQYGWLRRKHSIAISETLTGRTKETHPGVKAMSEKLTGRTKETHEYIRLAGEKTSETLSGRTKETHNGVNQMSEKKTGRTKETCPGVKAMSEKRTGRTKETHEYLRLAGEKLTGRTKETHDGIRRGSEKLTGRTKETHEYLRLAGEKISEKQRKLSDEQEQILFNMRENKIPGKDIQEYFKKQNINLVYSSISTIYNRVKRETFLSLL